MITEALPDDRPPRIVPAMKRKPTTQDERPTLDDAALFREAIGEVRVVDAPAPLPARPKPKARARRLELDEFEALKLSREPSWFELSIAGEAALAYRRPEVPEKLLKDLKRGRFSVQDEVDLHSLRAVDAERWLKRFLLDARHGDRLCVRIIHGKGQRSAGEGSVLKGLVDLLLRQRGDVLAFASAPEAQGGTGAVLALLAKLRPGELAPPIDRND